MSITKLSDIEYRLLHRAFAFTQLLETQIRVNCTAGVRLLCREGAVVRDLHLRLATGTNASSALIRCLISSCFTVFRQESLDWALENCAEQGDVEAIKAIAARGGNMRSYAALFRAIKGGHKLALIHVLNECALTSVANFIEPFWMPIQEGSTETVQLLLDHGFRTKRDPACLLSWAIGNARDLNMKTFVVQRMGGKATVDHLQQAIADQHAGNVAFLISVMIAQGDGDAAFRTLYSTVLCCIRMDERWMLDCLERCIGQNVNVTSLARLIMPKLWEGTVWHCLISQLL